MNVNNVSKIGWWEKQIPTMFRRCGASCVYDASVCGLSGMADMQHSPAAKNIFFIPQI
jgi:hypothetical protein